MARSLMSKRNELEQLTRKLLTKEDGRYVLDVRGYTCPYPQLLAGTALELIEKGSTVEVLTDNPPSCENVPRSVKNRGQKFLRLEDVAPGLWKIIAEKVN